MMKRYLVKGLHWMVLSLLLGAAAPTLAAEQDAPAEDLWAGKQRTGRSIEIKVVVDATPQEAYDLWLSADNLRRFFAPTAHIDPVVGGRYEVVFDPQGDPEGERDGTKGARILELHPGSFIAFEWKGRASMKDMNVRPLPTWVELSFLPVEGKEGKTRVSLAHHGFGTGGTWELAYVFFQSAWRAVLDSLQVYCAKHQAQPAAEEDSVIARLASDQGWRATLR